MEIFADRSRDPVSRNQQLRKKHLQAALVEYIRLCGSFFLTVFPPLFRRKTTSPIPDCIIYFRPGKGLMHIGPQDLRRLFSNVSRFFSSSRSISPRLIRNTTFLCLLHFLSTFSFISCGYKYYKNSGIFVGKITSIAIVKRR